MLLAIISGYLIIYFGLKCIVFRAIPGINEGKGKCCTEESRKLYSKLSFIKKS